MTEKKELKQEELEKVSGGSNGSEGVDSSGQFTGFIDMYSLHDSQYFNKEYYFIRKDSGDILWFRARLNSSYEQTEACGTTSCTHDIKVTESGNDPEFFAGDKLVIGGEKYAAYTTKNW